MLKAVRAILKCVNHSAVAHNGRGTGNVSVNVALSEVMHADKRYFAHARAVYHKRIHRRQAHALRLRGAVCVHHFKGCAVNAHRLFKLRVNRGHILHNIAVLDGFDVVAVRASVGYGIADKIAFRDVNNILCVIADYFIVGGSVACAAARADSVITEIIVAKPLIPLAQKLMSCYELRENCIGNTAF